jgi:hypothetical protein
MKARTIFVLVALCLGAVAVYAASDVNIGTWKLNEGKSKIPPMAPKNNTVTYTAAGDGVKVTIDGVDGQGKPLHTEWTGKYDGKDYPVTGDATSDMRSYKKVNDHTFEITSKKDGKVTLTARLVVAADGKSRTVTANTTDPSGNKITYSGFYEKQ